MEGLVAFGLGPPLCFGDAGKADLRTMLIGWRGPLPNPVSNSIKPRFTFCPWVPCGTQLKGFHAASEAQDKYVLELDGLWLRVGINPMTQTEAVSEKGP